MNSVAAIHIPATLKRAMEIKLSGAQKFECKSNLISIRQNMQIRKMTWQIVLYFYFYFILFSPLFVCLPRVSFVARHTHTKCRIQNIQWNLYTIEQDMRKTLHHIDNKMWQRCLTNNNKYKFIIYTFVWFLLFVVVSAHICHWFQKEFVLSGCVIWLEFDANGWHE